MGLQESRFELAPPAVVSEREPHYAGTPAEERPQLPRQPVHVVLDNIRSAFNVGSIFRTADAGAVAHIHLCGMSAAPPHKKLEKTALGAFEYVPWTYYERTSDCLRGLKAQGISIAAVEVAESAIPYSRYEWPSPVAVVFGNEVNGINERHFKHCDAIVCIPMHGFKNSINVSTAFGIILYDVLQRWKVV